MQPWMVNQGYSTVVGLAPTLDGERVDNPGSGTDNSQQRVYNSASDSSSRWQRHTRAHQPDVAGGSVANPGSREEGQNDWYSSSWW